MKKEAKEGNLIYLVGLMFFTILLGIGAVCMQYGMLNPNINLGFTLIGLIGTAICGAMLVKR